MVAASFTQIVWKSTKSLGLAVVQKEGKNFVIAVYRPAGNFQGKYSANVGSPVAITSNSRS